MSPSNSDSPPNPFEKLMTLWVEGAKTYTDAMQAMVDMVAKISSAGSPAESAADPVASLQSYVEHGRKAFTRLADFQTSLFHQWLNDLPTVGRQRLDAQTFSQLNRLASDNWQSQLAQLGRSPAERLEQLGKSDLKRLTGLFESMLSEYLHDLQALDEKAFCMNLTPLTEAWAKILSGSADEQSDKIVGRFLQAMSVKARYGTEYYADPETTPVGQTPRTLVGRHGKIELYRYLPAPNAPARRGDPALVVYSVINKSYILDLIKGYSFIEHLLEQGLDVFMVEWGPTEPGDRTTTLDSYIDPGLTYCVDTIRELTGARKVSLFGHCIGGNLALMYAALYPEQVSRLVILTTPVTSAKGGVVALWTDKDVFPIDAIIDTFGHMPAKLIRYTFMALKPYYEVMKWKMFFENLGNDAVMSLFYPVDRWANENVDIPGEMFRKIIHEVFHADRFCRSETTIHGRRVVLGDIICPIMNLAASQDWIVPIESAALLNDLVGSKDNRFVEIESAHVGIMMDPRTRPLWTQMSDFLLESAEG